MKTLKNTPTTVSTTNTTPIQSTKKNPNSKKQPLRKCVGCQNMFDKREMLRVVKTADGIGLDPSGKQDGRGAYICKNPDCLAMAVKKRGLERSLKTPISSDIYENLREEMKHIDG